MAGETGRDLFSFKNSPAIFAPLLSPRIPKYEIEEQLKRENACQRGP